MIEYARLDLLYKSALFRTIRILLFALLVLLCYSQAVVGQFPKLPLFFLELFVVSEIFYHFHIAKVIPQKKVQENDQDSQFSCTKQALEYYLSAVSSAHLLALLLKDHELLYFLGRLGITKKEVIPDSVEKKDVIINAKEVALRTGGVYITSLDLLCAYLLLTESQTKLLFDKEIKPEDLIELISFVRKEFDHREYPRSRAVHFDGEGFGEALITGWTPLTKQFTVDWTSGALGKKRYLVGREGEYRELLEALTKKENNNVLLVGDPGIGKETLLTTLVQDSFSGTLPAGLNHKRLLELMASSLLAGASDQGILEARLVAIIEEIAHAGDVFLYIPEFQHVLGSADLHLDLSGILLPHLQSGRLPIIGTMSQGNFKTYLEKNPIVEAFGVVILEPPEEKALLGILLARASELERLYQGILTLPAIRAGIQFAHVYLPDEALPGSAVQLLSDAMNTAVAERGKRIFITAQDITGQIEKKTHVPVGAPKETEKDLLLHLEDSLHERVVDQVQAITAIAEAMRRVRSGLGGVATKPISFLFLGPTGVGKTETAKALADLYFRGESHIVRLDMSEYSDAEGEKRLLGAAPGEGIERGELTDKIHDNPYSLVLLDEFEKAHPRILDLFLQVLEDGRLTDNKGRTVSFDNAIIIATSNAASEYIREQIAGGKSVDKVFHQSLLDYLQSQHIFKPELLNRFDEIITFTPLGQNEIVQITSLLLKKVIERLKEQDILLSFDDAVIAKIGKEGFDPQFGARPLRRYIQDHVEDLLAKMKLEDKLKRGNSARMTLGNNDEIVIEVT